MTCDWVWRGCCALAACVIAASTPARAQAPPANWQGWYFGGVLGWATTEVDSAVDGARFSDDYTAITGGPLAGYNFAITNAIIAGLETDITFADLAGDTSLARHKASFVGRLGFLATPSLLVFGVVGLAGGQYEADITASTSSVTFVLNDEEQLVPVVSTSTARVNKDKRLWGLTLGGGFETSINAFAFPIRLGVEYRYTDFEQWNFVAVGHAFSIEPEVHEVRFRLIVPIN